MSLFFFDGAEVLKRYRKILFIALMILFAIGYVFFSPLTYGLPLSSEQYDLRVWMKGWK
jgi:dolichyl-phosphate-mannose--protein O-mannosyl transferase